MGEPCDICAGFTDRGIALEEMMITCSKCKISREHIYCMRVIPSLVEDWDPDNWVCESCEQRKVMLSPNSRIKEDKVKFSTNRSRYNEMHLACPSTNCNVSGWKAHSKRQKPVVNGKVQFISNEEVRMLSLADPPRMTPPVGCKIVTSKSPGFGVKEKSSFISSEITVPHRRGRPPKMQSLSKMNQLASQYLKHSQDAETPKETATEKKLIKVTTSRHLSPKSTPAPAFMSTRHAETFKETVTEKKLSKVTTLRHLSPKSTPEKRALGTPTKVHIIKEQPIDPSLLSQGVETSSRMTVEEPTNFLYTPSRSRNSPFTMSYGGNTSKGEENQLDGGDKYLLNLFPSVHLFRSYSPAPHAIWKGGFIIFDSESAGQFIGGFQARPPCTVHCKAYEFSQKMPLVLRANLLPRLHLWADPFLEECPDLQDVSLYFFPDDNIAGSRETYALLFEVMETQNSVMKIYFDGVDAVDLLIFTAKQLHFDSLNTVTGPSTINFLWGVFLDKNHCRSGLDDNGTAVDMEVDMIGGKIVGTVDVVVPKYSPTSCRSPKPIMKAVEQLLTIKNDEHFSYLTRLRILDSTIKKLLAFDSDEPSASSEMKSPCRMQLKLEKDEAEICLESCKKTLPYLPCIPESNPQSSAGSTDEVLGTTSTLDEIALLGMLSPSLLKAHKFPQKICS